MENTTLQLLAKRLNLINHETKEPYILTKEEEDTVIANEIKRAKEFRRWKLEEQGFKEGDILLQLSEIVWNNEINREEVLSRANSSKHYELWQCGQREREKQEETTRAQELKTVWTAKQFFNLMSWSSEKTYGKKLILHNDNKHLISTLCFFISGDERFKTELGYSFDKGLLIRGVSGLGKTFLVKCISKNPLSPIRVESMIDISEEIKRDGEYHVSVNGGEKIYLDDVGTEEPTINHYGTKISFFKNFIEMYYLQNKAFSDLIISTNNSFAEIEERYGFRVRSRMKDMFNVIDVKGKDMRG